MCDLLTSYQKGHHPAWFNKCWWKEGVVSPRFFQVSDPNSEAPYGQKWKAVAARQRDHCSPVQSISVLGLRNRWPMLQTSIIINTSYTGEEDSVLPVSPTPGVVVGLHRQLPDHCDTFSSCSWNETLQLTLFSPSSVGSLAKRDQKKGWPVVLVCPKQRGFLKC